MDLKLWCDKNLIDYSYIDGEKSFMSNDIQFIIISAKDIDVDGVIEKKLFDEDFRLILDSSDHEDIEYLKAEYFLFEFGEQWYYSKVLSQNVELNLFKYFGKAKQNVVDGYSFLGVHTGFELCNGSRLAEDWVSKAKFLSIDNLGVCELNTLAGVLKFQEACKKEKIKSIIGETIIVNDGKERYELKLFVENEKGWQNLLNINAQINVFNDGFVSEQYLLDKSEGLTCVISCSKILEDDFLNKIHNVFKNYFYQIDLVRYSSNEKDKEHLAKLQYYLSNYKDDLSPILLCDSYYLDQEDYEIKSLLNKIGKIGFKYQSKDQHFKSVDEIIKQARELNLKEDFINQCYTNTLALSNLCNFKIETGVFHLPKYMMTDEEAKINDTNEDLFFSLISKGFDDKIKGNVIDEDAYWQRIEKESKVLLEGNLVDYFLILADIISWCHREDILVGVGRGSAAGSMIAYLLGICELDPIKYDLIFERFMNEARLKNGEFADIDSDFESSRRDDVKKYMEQRYGVNYFASIATYGNFKNKSAIKDLSRELGISYQDVSLVSSIISYETADGEIIDLFKNSLTEPKLKAFINQHYKLINKLHLIIGQPKNLSVHACATVIVPSEKDIYTSIPVRSLDGVLVTEWEGKEVEKAGFLKEDILSILQLDKFRMVIDLIKRNHGVIIDYTKIDVEDKNVYETLFHKGYCEDVFQFGTEGLKKYCRSLKPDRFEELIVANAIYRPGAMLSNAHLDYVKIKFGTENKVAEYDYLLEDVTKDTQGLYVFQEQVMRAFQIITDSTLEEADMFRKIVTKLSVASAHTDENYEKYRNIFVSAYLNKGQDAEKAEEVWQKLIVFSKYAFNRSHAACYAYEGYVCNWFKFHYPIEFWVTALKYSDEDDIEKKILEIENTGSIKLMPPNINESAKEYTYDSEKQTIYWALNSVKFAGDKSVDDTIAEREKNGKFKSFSDFLFRIKETKVNKRVITNFILCGCFDEVEKLNSVIDRYRLLKHFLGDDLGEEFSPTVIIKEYFWLMTQKDLCGIGNIKFKRILDDVKLKVKIPKGHDYHTFEEIFDKENLGNDCLSIGVINEIKEFSTKNGKAAWIELKENGRIFRVTLWNEFWSQHHETIKASKGKIIAITGSIRSYKEVNTMQSNNESVMSLV